MIPSIKKQFPPDLKKLQAKADTLFQLGRRLEESDEHGNCECISCGVFKHYKQMQGGHYISRQYTAVKYEKNNCWPQCVHCNHFLKGNVVRYRKNLIKIVGEREVLRLESKMEEIVPFKRLLIEKVIEEYSWAKKGKNDRI